MGSNISSNRKFIAVAVVAVSLFAIATLAAKSIGPVSAQDQLASGGANHSQSTVAKVEQNNFEVSLKSLSSALYNWSSRKPEENAY